MKKPFQMLTVLLCILCMITAVLPANASEAAEESTVTVYFTTPKNIRPRLAAENETLGLIQPFQPVTVTPVNGKWGSMVLDDGRTGFIFMDGMIPMPEYEWIPEVERYSPEAIPLLGVPIQAAKAYDRLDSWELCVEDGRCDGYIHIRIPGRDLTGYVPEGTLQALDFPLPEEADQYTVVCDREVDLTSMPLKGAEITGKLPADTMITAFDAGYGEHLMIREEETVSWVHRDDVCACLEDAESGMPMFIPFGENPKTEPGIVFRYATVKDGGVTLVKADGSSIQAEAGERMMVCLTYGSLATVTGADHAGYAPADRFETETTADKAAHIRALDLSGAGIPKSEWLDVAFTMLEEDNSLLLRYNAITDSNIQTLFPLGVPYFWGGRNIYLIKQRAPEYNTGIAWQSSPVYYRKGTLYLTGFDCVGFVKAVCEKAKHPVNGALKDLINGGYHTRGSHVWCKADRPMPDDWKKVAEELEIGDILILFHPGEHVLIYAGTLRQYGYTEDTLPAAAKYLDNPLMIQCGEDPFYYLRMTEYIRTSEDPRIARATPPDGGVNFCILGVPFEDAEYLFICHDAVCPCFLAEGTCINIYNFDTVTNYAFYRTPAKPATATPAVPGTPVPTATPVP